MAGERARIVPRTIPPFSCDILFREHPGMQPPHPRDPHAVRYAVNHEMTWSRITAVTGNLDVPVKLLDYREGDHIILYIGDQFSACMVPVPPSQALILFYDRSNDALVVDNRSLVDASHLVGKHPRPGRTHVLYVAVVEGALAHGPENSLMTTPAFITKVTIVFLFNLISRG